MDVISYPCWDLSYTMSVKGGPGFYVATDGLWLAEVVWSNVAHASIPLSLSPYSWHNIIPSLDHGETFECSLTISTISGCTYSQNRTERNRTSSLSTTQQEFTYDDYGTYRYILDKFLLSNQTTLPHKKTHIQIQWNKDINSFSLGWLVKLGVSVKLNHK